MDILNDLKSKNLIPDEVVLRVEERVGTGGESYEQALLNENVSAELLRNELAAYFAIPAYILNEDEVLSQKVLAYIPEESARHYKIVPLKVEDDILVVGTNDPENLQTRDVLNFISSKHGLPYKLVFLLEDDLEIALKAYDNLSGEVDEALVTLEDDLSVKVSPEQRKQESKSALEHIKEDAPVTKIVATVLRYAVDGGASDIHIEPTDTKVRVRFRVDGLLSTSLELPNKVHSAVVARVKILSSMRLDEKRKPQDGRFSATFDGRKIDFRVSILPTNHGEKVVMRILDNVRGVSTLKATGISDHNLEAIRRMVKEPFGIILISGPTGSGKSTTLYAMLGEIDKQGKNVLSLEDPVEYNIDGVSQSQVRPEIGYTFAAGLRSALRQDPDVILVGEIRDKETAQLAIQAALTGHLVLSTIHTNNSIGVIPRLIDMGVDPYLIAPTLKLALAQRLARRVCPGTGKEISIEGSITTMIEREFETLPEEYRNRVPDKKTVLHPEPSPGCASGTKGRVAVMEALEINGAIEELILAGSSEEDIYKEARSHGFMSMKEDAIIKALDHLIPYEEVSSFGTKVGQENVLNEKNLPVDNLLLGDDPAV
ncbi:GspE/PulE family protein [Candidatus Pacebacteria bacterium]|nr:GspE/PulE family protein [Candidatus Paceibacterota bacterium]